MNVTQQKNISHAKTNSAFSCQNTKQFVQNYCEHNYYRQLIRHSDHSTTPISHKGL